MKKIIAVFLVLAVLLAAFPAASADDFLPYGGYYPSIVKAFSRGQADEYSFWTRDNTQTALLAILLVQDMMREDYSAYNRCFPTSSLSCVMYNTGRRDSNTIKAMYVCSDGYLSLEYDLDIDTVMYYIDDRNPSIEAFPAYVTGNYGQYFDSCIYNYYNFDLYDPTPAYSMAAQAWSNYHDHHPELDSSFGSYIGY